MQVLPSPHLLPYLKHYLFLESKGESIKKLRLFSDGNTGVVFTRKGRLFADSQSNELSGALPPGFVYGQITQCRDIYVWPETSLVIAVFQPNGFSRLTHIPALEIRDTILSLDAIFGNAGLEVYERIAERRSIQGHQDVLDAFFSSVTNRKPITGHFPIQAALDFIIQRRGLSSVQQLIKYTGYTERHLERKFNEAVGLSPKTFGSVVRLHHFLKQVKQKPGKLTPLAYETGYTDQSHLVREFKKYTGLTPKEYIHQAQKLAVNFVEFQPTDA